MWLPLWSCRLLRPGTRWPGSGTRAPALVAIRRRRVQRLPADGFTLLELLVAMVIVSVLVGMLAWSVGSADRGLHFEAQRLAQLLILAREEAQLRGATIRLEADESGYRFAILRNRRWQILTDDRDLRPRNWEEPTQMQIRRQDHASHVEFRVEEIDVPFVIRLHRGDGEETIVSTAPGTIGVRK